MAFNSETGKLARANAKPRGKNKPKDYLKHLYESVIGSLKLGSYYVYYHSVNGKIFYIGMGKNGRAWECTKGCRNHRWASFVESINFQYDVKIVAAELTRDEASCIEEELIKIRKPSCNIAYNEDLIWAKNNAN